MNFKSCLAKQRCLVDLFASFPSQEKKYFHIMKMGKTGLALCAADRTPRYLVSGCQSLLYLRVNCVDGVLSLASYSDALISAGLAALFVYVYNKEPPEAVLVCPPTFIKEIGLIEALSPSRANGLNSLYARLKLEAAQALAAPRKCL